MFKDCRKKGITVLSLLLTMGSLMGQTELQHPFTFQLPQSPNAASLAKYGNIPVNLNSGLASPSVEIFTIETDGVTVPVNLTYSNSGLKVDEIPGWVGLGWDLQSGGLITHTVRGLPDDSPVGLLRHWPRENLKKTVNNNISAYDRFLYYRDIYEGQVDSEYDQFTGLKSLA